MSERTKAGLAVAKQRGVKLGATGAGLAKRHRAEAQARAEQLGPVIRELQHAAFPCAASPPNSASARWKRRAAALGTRISSPASSSGSKEGRRKKQRRPTKRVTSRKLLRDRYAPGQNNDGTFNIGASPEMFPRMLQWKCQQEVLDRGGNPTLITLDIIKAEMRRS